MKIKPIAVSDLVRQLNLQFIGSDFTITDLCSILSLRPYALTFSNKPQVLMKLSFPLAIISQNKPDSAVTWIQSDNPIYDFVRACKILLVEEKPLCGENYAAFIHPTVKFNPALVHIGHNVVILENTEIGDESCLEANCVIGRNVKLGKKVHLQPGVKVLDYCEIGDNCVIGAGTVIGSEGFGFIEVEGRLVKFPQLGKVIIGPDCEIGANVTIDRGALDDTVIGSGVKIDNLVQIGHNVKVGSNSIICGQVGIAGSSIIGSNCVLGGQVGVKDHVRIADYVRVGGKSGVTSDIVERGDYLAIFPAVKANQWKKFLANLKRQLKSWELAKKTNK